MLNKKWFSPKIILLAAIVLGAVAWGGLYLYSKKAAPFAPQQNQAAPAQSIHQTLRGIFQPIHEF